MERCRLINLKKAIDLKWMVFVLFALVLLIKTMCFHFYTEQSILLSSIVNHPSEFFRFWIGKILPSIFLGSFIFLSRRFWWTIIVNLCVDIWAIANLFYYKANHLYLTCDTMMLASNMNGFWDSLRTYMGIDILSFLLITLLYSLLLILVVNKQSSTPSIKLFGLFLLGSVCLMEINIVLFYKYYNSWFAQVDTIYEELNVTKNKNEFTSFFPFGYVHYAVRTEDFIDANYMANVYIHDQSIISYFPACLLFKVLQPNNELIELTLDQHSEIDKLLRKIYSAKDVLPNSNLIIILVESLETWALEEFDGYCYCPNMASLIKNKHTLYSPNITSQVLHGNSADGQMIVVSGLLPIKEGATCVLYGENHFPSFAEKYHSSAIFSQDDSWQQSTVTFSYQFKELLVPKSLCTHTHTRVREGMLGKNDANMMRGIENYIDTVAAPFCCVGITGASHVPFRIGVQQPRHTIDNMPANMSAYLNCLSYTDSCLGNIIDEVINCDSITLVITGDHTVFRSRYENMNTYFRTHDYSYTTPSIFTPLIVYSPFVDENILVTDTCFQMDIYPTILQMVGLNNEYYWNGVGVSLLNNSIDARILEENRAYEISDWLIRSNYFEKYK